MREIIQHVFARGNVDLDVAPFLGRNFGEPPFDQRLAGRNNLDHAGMARRKIAISDGVFIAVMRWLKKRCLALSKAERAADFACAFKVPVEPVMLAACIAALRLLWMTMNAPA